MKNIKKTILRTFAGACVVGTVLIVTACQEHNGLAPASAESTRSDAPISAEAETAAANAIPQSTNRPTNSENTDVKPTLETEDGFVTYLAGQDIVFTVADEYGVADIKITVRYSPRPVDLAERSELPIVEEFDKSHFTQVQGGTGVKYELRFDHDTPGMYYVAYSATDTVGNESTDDQYSTGFCIVSAQLPEADFDFTWALTEGFAAVKLSGGRETYINDKGERAFDRDFKFAYNFSDGLARVWEDNDEDRFTFINVEGEQAFAGDFAGALDFQDGFAAVRLDNDRWTYINTAGEQAFDRDFKSAYSFNNDKALVFLDDGNMAYINKDGELVEK